MHIDANAHPSSNRVARFLWNVRQDLIEDFALCRRYSGRVWFCRFRRHGSCSRCTRRRGRLLFAGRLQRVRRRCLCTPLSCLLRGWCSGFCRFGNFWFKLRSSLGLWRNLGIGSLLCCRMASLLFCCYGRSGLRFRPVRQESWHRHNGSKRQRADSQRNNKPRPRARFSVRRWPMRVNLHSCWLWRHRLRSNGLGCCRRGLSACCHKIRSKPRRRSRSHSRACIQPCRDVNNTSPALRLQMQTLPRDFQERRRKSCRNQRLALGIAHPIRQPLRHHFNKGRA